MPLGRDAEAGGGVGFHAGRGEADAETGGPIVSVGDAHLATFAPTGAGKGVSCVIPALLTHPGSVVAFDPKGELFRVTARRRREMGQEVVVLNPFGVLAGGASREEKSCGKGRSGATEKPTTTKGDSTRGRKKVPPTLADEQFGRLNPLDMLTLPGADVETDARGLAASLAAGMRGMKDPFWDESGIGVVSGLIAHAATQSDPALRTLSWVHERLHCDDVAYNLATLLDSCGKTMNQFAYREIAAFLQHADAQTRPGVQATAASYLKCLAGGRVPESLGGPRFEEPTGEEKSESKSETKSAKGKTKSAKRPPVQKPPYPPGSSSFDLAEFAAGRPTTIYLVIPPPKLDSHRGLLRLWVATLLEAVMSRETGLAVPTLFLLDEAAQLGQFPPLERAVTLCRGYGARVWTFWQDLTQLKACYPTTWPGLLNNSGVKQAFGVRGAFAARGWAEVLDTPIATLRDLGADEQLLVLPDGVERRSARLDYRTDPQFAGLFDPNPRHAKPEPARRRAR
ncbi:MAG: type IV secretory system conjugative DNA transfer family protein [Planctomycetota bacterium]